MIRLIFFPHDSSIAEVMAKRSAQSNWQPVMASIFYPCAIGMALYLCAMTYVENSGSVLLIRYLAGHPVSKITTAMTLIGLVSLLQSARRVWAQCRDSSQYLFPSSSDLAKDDLVGRAVLLRDLVGRTLRSFIGYYRQQRLLAAASFVEQTGAADRLDDELKYLADVDAQRQADGYAFVRILVWAIPMLGFLGTVLGITQALGSMHVGPDNDFQQMMDGLRTGLYVAFDTTAQALSFSIALMFVQFVVYRCENQLLEQVDRQVRNDLSGWFVLGSSSGDAYVRTVQQIGRSILVATHEMSQTQIELWKRSIETAQAAWLETIQGNHEMVQRNLSDSIGSAVDRLTQRLGESIQEADAALEHRGQQWQVHLSQLTRQTLEQQQSVISSTQAVLAALRGTIPTSSTETQTVLDSITLKHTLQNLAHSLDSFTSHMARTTLDAIRTAAVVPESTSTKTAVLRIFKEDLAA